MNKSLGRCPECGEHYFKVVPMEPSVEPVFETAIPNGAMAYYHLPVIGGDYMEGAMCVVPNNKRAEGSRAQD